MFNYGSLDAKAGTMSCQTTCERSDWAEAARGYSRCMQRYACFDFNPSFNGGQPFFRSDFFSAREFRDLDIYSECFRLIDTLESAQVHVPTDDGCFVWFTAERSGPREFTERDRLMFTLARQHLANSHQLALARTSLRDEFPLDAATFSRAGFTARESEVAHWLTEGKSNQEIATLMKIRLPTVKAHVSELLNKTGTDNRLALTLVLIDLGRKFARTTEQLQHVTVRSGKPLVRH